MVAGKPQNCAFTWASQPCNAKNTVNTTVFDSMDGGGVEPTTSGLQAARGGGGEWEGEGGEIETWGIAPTQWTC